MATMIVELYDALKAAGAPEDKAQAAAMALVNRNGRFDRIDEKLATVVGELVEMKHDIVGVKHEIAGAKNEIAGVKNDVAGLKIQMAEVKTDVGSLKGAFGMMRWALGIIVAGVVALLVRSFWLGA